MAWRGHPARNKALGKWGRKRDEGLPADAVTKPPSGVVEVIKGVRGLAKELSKVVGLPAPLAEMMFPFLSQNTVQLLTESRTRPLTGPELKQLIRATQTARVQAARELAASEGEDAPTSTPVVVKGVSDV